jgi:glucosamine-6-phosphate isomerase
MRKVVYENYSELSVNTARQIAGIILRKPDALLCFPAGETSTGTFSELIRLNREGKISFRNCRIVGLDEWLDIGEMSKENCFSFLKKHLFDHIDYSPENLCFFDGESGKPKQECIKTDNFIKRYGPVDMMLLGAGMNGHLGLNEPGTPFDLYSHIVDIATTTKNVGQKYFSGKVKLERGITLGIRHIMESGTVILQISGRKKADVVNRLLNTEPTPEFPATALKSHDGSWLLLDREAAGIN